MMSVTPPPAPPLQGRGVPTGFHAAVKAVAAPRGGMWQQGGSRSLGCHVAVKAAAAPLPCRGGVGGGVSIFSLISPLFFLTRACHARECHFGCIEIDNQTVRCAHFACTVVRFGCTEPAPAACIFSRAASFFQNAASFFSRAGRIFFVPGPGIFTSGPRRKKSRIGIFFCRPHRFSFRLPPSTLHPPPNTPRCNQKTAHARIPCMRARVAIYS